MWRIFNELRFAVRRLINAPLFTIVAVSGIALGIGATTSVFSVVNGVFFRPLPFEHGDRLLIVSGYHQQIGRHSVSYADFSDLRENTDVFEHFAAFYQRSLTMTGDGEPERLAGTYVSASFFPMLGAKTSAGRFFRAEEEMEKGAPVVVLSHELWRSRFGSDLTVIGRTLMLDDLSHTVIGIAPVGFRPPVGAELWLPLSVPESDRSTRTSRYLRMFARLKPGVTVQEAQSNAATVMGRLEQEYPETNSGREVVLAPLHAEITGGDHLPLLMTLGTVFFVLLIACFNLANLYMARAFSRTKQTGIHRSLGANRLTIALQFLSESILLALAGGALGLLFSVWARDILIAWLSVSPLIETDLDTRILLFTLGVSLMSGLIAGLIPAVRMSRVDPLSTLKEGGTAGSTSSRGGLLNVLVSAEVGLALALAIGALLMVKSLSVMKRADLGFDSTNLLTLNLAIPENRYETPEQQAAFFAQVLEKSESLPGVSGSALVSLLPLSDMYEASRFFVHGRPAAGGGQINRASYHIVTPGYFETMRISLLEGRVFTEDDREGSREVAVVSREMALRFWPGGQSPIGERISLGDDQGPWITIVGVVNDVRYQGLGNESQAEFYRPLTQAPRSNMAMVLRAGSTAGLVNAVRGAVWSVDNNVPVYRPKTMEQAIDDYFGKEHALTNVLGMFGGVAIFLAGLGIYGVTSYTVSRRTREIGIRMALGARPAQVLGLAMRHSLVFIIVGVTAGLIASFFLTRMISSMLYGVEPLDPEVYALASLILVTIGVIATWLPASRASRLDPSVSLKEE